MPSLNVLPKTGLLFILILINSPPLNQLTDPFHVQMSKI